MPNHPGPSCHPTPRRRRARTSALGALVPTAGLLVPTAAGGSAQAGVASVYSITDVTKARIYAYLPHVTSCETRWDNPVVLHVRSAVTDPVWDGPVHVEGQRVELRSGDVVLGTEQLQSANLVPGEGASSNFLEVSCRQWRGLMGEGFGAGDSSYQVRVVGTGTAYDTSEGSAVGTVEEMAEPVPVTFHQLARYTKLEGRKARRGVRISTTMKVWSERGDSYAWRVLKRTRVDLLKMTRSGAMRRVDSARTGRRGNLTLRFAARRHNYMRLRLRGHTFSNGATYHVNRRGRIKLAGR